MPSTAELLNVLRVRYSSHIILTYPIVKMLEFEGFVRIANELMLLIVVCLCLSYLRDFQ